MKRFGLMMVASVLMLASWPARAEADAKTFLAEIDAGKKTYLYILDAYANGFDWANTDLRAAKRQPLYCLPAKLAVTAEQSGAILRQFIKQNPVAANWPAGMALLEAFKDTFPCKATE